MNTKNKKEYSRQRIAAAYIFGTMGAALVGSSVNNILQTTGEWPEWTIWLLSIGGTAFFVALIILVPFSWWRWLRRQLANTPRNIQTIYWLQSVLRYNKDKIHDSVKARFIAGNAWDFSGITSNPLDPNFKIHFELTNTSIFDMRILCLDGKIIVDTNECLGPTSVNKISGIKQGDTVSISITQSVSELMLKRIKKAIEKKEKLQFNLTSLNLILETTTKIYKGYKIYIKFENYEVLPS